MSGMPSRKVVLAEVDRNRAWTCPRKRPFDTQADTQADVERIYLEEGVRLHPYPCGDHWHLSRFTEIQYHGKVKHRRRAAKIRRRADRIGRARCRGCGQVFTGSRRRCQPCRDAIQDTWFRSLGCLDAPLP